jgi:hypothetical protein
MALALFPAAGPRAVAQGELPKLFVYVEGTTQAEAFVFVPVEILIPQMPIILNVTFRNNESIAGVLHSFTLNDGDGNAQINTGLLDRNETASVEFTVLALDAVEVNGTAFTPESGDRGILFYCIPHRGAEMVGEIVLASGPVEGPGEGGGVLLRAYWIGMIGIFAMILWIVISYFVIKSSSRRFTDHKAHLRKGLP